jgi:hypothetical protein
MTVRSTPEARLLDAGWSPPAALRTAIERREALRSAIDGLKTRGYADSGPILRAIGEADRDSIITGIVSDAIGKWLDANCQSDSSPLTDWSFAAEQALLEAVYAAAPTIVESLAAMDSPDTAYLLAEATRASTPDPHVAMMNGRPSPARLGRVSLFRALVPR